MAALRYAAKKLCGHAAIPRQRALCSALVSRAFEEEPRRLLPGLILGEMMPSCSYRRSYSAAPPSNIKHQLPSCKESVANAKSHVNMDHVSLELQIKEKKEELLHLLLKKERAQENKELLYMLSKTHMSIEDKKARGNKQFIFFLVYLALLFWAQYLYIMD